MKKVLILAYDFPPYVSVAGLRPKAWFDYFQEFDIEPIVITRQWDAIHNNKLDYLEKGSSDTEIIEKHKNGTIIRAPFHPNLSNRLLLKHGHSKYKLIRKMITAWYEFFQFPLAIGGKSEIYKSATRYLAENKVDCIIATGEPFVLFQYANKLSKAHKTPWIADYRDVWSSFYEHTNRPIEAAVNRFYQKKTMKSVDLISTVSELVQNKIKQHVSGKEFLILQNGYDPAAIEQALQVEQSSDKLRIAMVGTIQPWNPMESFLKSLNEILEKNNALSFELHFFGVNSSEHWQAILAQKFPFINEKITFHSKMKNADLLKKLASFNVFLLFNYYSFMGTKIYDYLALQRKILFCFSNDQASNELKRKYFYVNEMTGEDDKLQENLIRKTNGGVIVENHDQLEKHLLELSSEMNEKGKIECDSKDIQEYSRKGQTERLAKKIHELF